MGSGRLIKNIGFYFLSTFATKLLQFLFIPIYSKYIISSEFGYFNLVISVISLLVPILYQSIWEGVLRFLIDSKKDEQKILSTTNIYCASISIVYIFIYILITNIYKVDYSWLILLMGLSQLGASYWQFTARAMQQNKIFAVSSVLSTITTIALNLIFVIFLNWGLFALLIANTGGNIVMIIYLEFNMKIINKTNINDFDINKLKTILKYSIPLSINAVSWWLMSSANNLVIVNRLGTEVNGIYSMANRFGSILALITSVINMAWLEESFRSFGEKNKDEYFNNVFEIMMKIVFAGILLLIPLTFIIYEYMVFGNYKEGIILTPLIYMSAGFSTFASHLGSGFLARKESKIVFITTLIGGIVSVIGGILLSDLLGVFGVMLTSLLGYMIMLGIRIPLLKKRMNLEINYQLLVGYSLSCIVVSFLSNMIPGSVVYQMSIIIILTVILLFLNRKLINNLIRKNK